APGPRLKCVTASKGRSRSFRQVRWPDDTRERRMTAAQIDRNPSPTRLDAGALARWGRPLAITTAVVFLISSLFPLGSGLARDSIAFPKLWGVLDVGVAFVLAVLALAVLGLTQGKVTREADDAAFRAYRTLLH